MTVSAIHGGSGFEILKKIDPRKSVSLFMTISQQYIGGGGMGVKLWLSVRILKSSPL
jgi:hypothetical protein